MRRSILFFAVAHLIIYFNNGRVARISFEESKPRNGFEKYFSFDKNKSLEMRKGHGDLQEAKK